MPPAHRHDDPRACGAKTVVLNQDSVTVNEKLWAVKGTTNNHGNGQLINSTGDSVTIHGIPVIVHGPDDSEADNIHPKSTPKTAGGSDNVSAYG